MSRVSTRRPPCENSFHKRVPAGNFQASVRLASIEVPGGIAIQRRFCAPSDQRAYCGAKAMTDSRTSVLEPGLYSPVSLSRWGSAGTGVRPCAPPGRPMVESSMAHDMVGGFG